MGSISAISSSLLQPSVFSGSDRTGNHTTGKTEGASGDIDNNQISPLAHLLGELQSLQQTDPAKYKEATSQIAGKLQSAALADTANGNSAGANQLTLLANDFTNASASGQLPNLQDVAKSIGGGGHHHHHGHGGPPPAAASDDTSAGTNVTVADQLRTAYQNNLGQKSSTDPFALITETLSASGS